MFFCFVGFHGQFYVWAVWGTVVLLSFSSWDMRWNGACADLQLNIILKCVICLCRCPCSLCSVELLWKIIDIAWWLSGLFYRQHVVDMSSLATCTAVEVMLDVQSHLIIDFKLISPFSFQLICLPPFLRLETPVKLRRRCWNSRLINKLCR
jgi:hypothetical protein